MKEDKQSKKQLKSFIKALELTNQVHAEQQFATVELAAYLLEETISLVEEANRISMGGKNKAGKKSARHDKYTVMPLDDLIDAFESARTRLAESHAKLVSDMQSTQSSTAASGSGKMNPGLEALMANAVVVQRETAVVANAALTQGISSMNAIVSAAIGVNEQKTAKRD